MVFHPDEDGVKRVNVTFESSEEQEAVIAALKKLPEDDRDVMYRDGIVAELQVNLDAGEDWIDLEEDDARTLQVCLERYGFDGDAMRLLDAMSEAGI